MDIALIAMSGVRVIDPDLIAMGLNLPGFVERSEVIASMPSLGLLTLAGLTPAEHQVRYFEAANEDDLKKLPQRADVVAISSLSSQIAEAYTIADQYRARGVTVIMGGLHVSSLPDEALEHADAVIVGQGEPAWLELLADIENGSLKPRYEVDPKTPVLRDPPMPAWHLLDVKRYNRIPVQTTRGCPHRCSYCASSILISHAYQQKSVERVLEEIDAIAEIWPNPFIEFADDNSFVNRRWWKEFLPKLAERNIKWFTECDVAVAEDEELLSLLAASGCRQILIGLESPDLAAVRGLERRRDWKAQQVERYRDAIIRIQDHGVTVNGCFILGLDGQNEHCFDAIREFVATSGLYEVQITLLTAFPGTPLYQEMATAGRLLHAGDWSRCTLFDLTIDPVTMSAETLHREFLALMRDLYAANVVAERRRRFHERLKQVRRASA